jgi:hypothetical protein
VGSCRPLDPRWLGFCCRPVPVGVLADLVALGTRFSWSTSVFTCQYHCTSAPCSFFYLQLLLPEGQTNEAWLLVKQCFVGYRRNIAQKSSCTWNVMELLWQRKPEVLRENSVTPVRVFSEYIRFSLSLSLTSAPYIHMLLFTRRVKWRSLGTVKK